MTRLIDGFAQSPHQLYREPPPPPPPPAPEVKPEVPQGVNEQVKAAVDAVVGDQATPEQRTQAYEELQQYYDAVASGGDFTGIDAATLEVNAVRTLTDAGIPTQFQPEVVQAVDQVVKDTNSSIGGVYLPGATQAQVLEAYAQVQAHVDGIGGLNGAGIAVEALPGVADQLLRESGIPTESGATTTYVEDALAGFEDMNDQQKIEALAEATSRLEQQTADLDPAAAAAVIDQALKPIEDLIGEVEMGGALVDQMWAPAWTSLATMADRIAGTPQGDALLGRMGEAMFTSGVGPGNFNLLAPLRNEGVGMPLFLRMAEQVAGGDYPQGASDIFTREIGRAMDDFVDTRVDPAIEAYAEHTSELNWLLQNLGPAATPEQLQQATQDYIDANPGWQEKHDQLQAAVADQGGVLLQQIEALDALPPGISDTFGDSAESRIKSLLEGDSTGFAIATAAGTDPEALEGIDLPEMVGMGQALGLTNSGASVIKSLAAAHVQHNIVGSLAQLDPADAASVADARAQIATLRNPAIATALGLDPSKLTDLNAAVDALGETLPNGETLSQLDVETRLQQFNEKLDGLEAFDQSQPLGQVFRGIGVAAGVASLWGSTTGFISDPSLEGGVALLSDAAGLSTAVGELATGMGAIPADSAWARFSASSTLGKVLGSVGIGLGLVGVVDNLADGDLTMAGISAAGVGGGALALFGSASWAGPVGVAIGLVAAAASFGVGIHRANEAETQREDVSRDFLQSMGFSDDAAEILSDFSGDGHSSLPLLAEYASHKGYDLTNAEDQQAFVEWVNDMPANTLESLRDALNHAIDDFDGDAGKLGSDDQEPATEYDVNPSTGSATPRLSEFDPRTVGEIDAFLRQRGNFGGGSILPDAP